MPRGTERRLRRRPPICPALLLPFLVVLPLKAQESVHGPLVLSVPTSAAAVALGGAYPASAAGPDALFVHPALIGDGSGVRGSFARYGSASSHASVSGSAEWWSGRVAIGVQSLGYGVEPEGPFLPGSEAELRSGGSIGVSEQAVSVGFARDVFGPLAAGVVGRLVDLRRGGERKSAYTVDFGAAADLGAVTLAASLRGIGSDLELPSGTVELPVSTTLSASTRRTAVGPLDIAGAAQVERTASGDAVAGLGAEVAYWPVNGRTFIGRIGLTTSPDELHRSAFTFGGGFQGDRVILEYAYQGFDLGDGLHRFGLGWR